MLAQSAEEVKAREIKTQFLLSKGRELDDQKLSLVNQLNDINSALSLLWIEYGALHNSAVFVNRIPSEVLCLIFLHCHNVPTLNADGYYVYEHAAPTMEVVLTHVCHHWRNTAVHLPELWSSFRYTTPRWKRDSIDRFSTYLHRSGPRLIELFIHFTFSSHEDMALLKAAALHLDRWRHVTIISEDNRFNWSQLQEALKNKEATNLEYFSFRPSLFVSAPPNGQISPVAHLEPKIFTLGAPKLTQIHLDSTVPYFFLPPMSNVTVFCLDAKYIGPSSITWNAFLDIVALPPLSSLSIGGDVLLGPNSDSLNAPVVTHTLKHLRWSGDGERLHHLLSYLDAPNLETLILCRLQLPPKPRHPSAFVSLPALRSLYIIECVQLSSHYIQFLAPGCPNIKHLSMSYYRPEAGHLLGYLNQEFETGSRHWMQLESVTCYIDGVDAVAPYLSFIEARNRNDRPLMTLRVSRRLHEDWQAQSSDDFFELEKVSIVKPWSSSSDILPFQWPPDGNLCVLQSASEHSSQFTFAIDWNEF